MNSFEFAIHRLLIKLFETNNIKIIEECRDMLPSVLIICRTNNCIARIMFVVNSLYVVYVFNFLFGLPGICIHTCIHTYIHTYIYTYIHTYIENLLHAVLLACDDVSFYQIIGHWIRINIRPHVE